MTAPQSSASQHGHGAHLNCGGMTNPHCGQCSQSNIMMSPTPHGEHDPYEKVPAGPRFPPPRSVDDPETKLGQTCFIVRDPNGHALDYVYFEDEPGRRSAG